MSNLRLSKTSITSYRGDVLPLYLTGEEIDRKADVKWSVTGDAVTVKEFRGDGECDFTFGVLVVFWKVGNATVTAEYMGEKFTCHVTSRPIKKADPEGKMNHYRGDFHDHLSHIHKKDLFAKREGDTQLDYINTLKKDNRLDFSVISDHACVTNNYDFFKGFVDDESSDPKNFVLFPGSESELGVKDTDRLGVLRRNSGEIVTVNVADFASTDSWKRYYEVLQSAPEPVAVFAHPQVLGFSTRGIWNFCYDVNNTPEMLHAIRGIEIGKGDRGPIGSKILSGIFLHEFVYSVALDAGFKVSPTSTSDCHGPDWGFDSWSGKTVIMAPEKTREAFLDALRNNRFYATESGNVKVEYKVNGKQAPTTLALTDTYKFHVEVSLFDKEKPDTMPVKCYVVSDYGKIVKTIKDCDLSSFDFEIYSDSARYFFLRFVDKTDKKTFSCPVWTGREFDKRDTTDYKAIDLSSATAFDIISGKDATSLIDSDPMNPWTSEGTESTVVIDLKKEEEISALGLSPVVIVRPVAPTADWDPTVDMAKLLYEYKVYGSLDGKEYTLLLDTSCRVFGGENIVRFGKTKCRYIKIEMLTNAGNYSEIDILQNMPFSVGNISLFNE
ncbi:MAG: discoidin domain-containing protein [Ruminococcaceae bacterium]|nr:discoidin domain-containing protein [Oscillospiraceae bacterium]